LLTFYQKQGVTVRFARTDSPDEIERLIDENTRAVFYESVENPAGNICDIAALALTAHNHGVPLIVDYTVATPILLKPNGEISLSWRRAVLLYA
jgi:O-acetylhomoserine (thiol)-lyase